MIEVAVTNNIEMIQRQLSTLDEKLRPEISKSLNRANHGVKTDTTRQIARTRSLKKSAPEINDWGFHDSTPDDLEAKAVIMGRRIGAEKYMKSGDLNKMEGKTSGGVTVNMLGKSVHFRHGFSHDVHANEMLIRQRKTGARRTVGARVLPKVDPKSGKRLHGRFPLKHLTTISAPQMADDDDVSEFVAKGAAERYQKQFNHQLNRLLEENL